MKRFVILCSLFLMSFVSLSAQEYRCEAKLGWVPTDVLNIVYLMGEDASGHTSYGPMKTIGIFSADFDYKVKNWLTVGANMNYRNSWRSKTTFIDGVKTNGIDCFHLVSVMPRIKLTTRFDSIFRLYAALGVGLGVDLSDGVNDKFLSVQLTPIGISVGRKISWYLEMGVGSTFIGYMTGLACRF